MSESESMHRITIEFGPKALAVLRARQGAEDLNPTTVVNRAVKLYGLLAAVNDTGGEVYVLTAPGAEPLKLQWEW